jgi:hypothetical protein
MCQAAINDKIKSDPKYFDKIQSKDELPYPCNLKRVLYGMQLMERQWYGDFFPNFSIVKLVEALREGRLDGDAITDFIPGKGDDVFQDILSFFTFTENRDNLTKLKERIQADIDQRQKEIDEEAERLRNRNPESGTFTGDEKGFKEYLSSISTTDKPKEFKKWYHATGHDPQGEDTNDDLYDYKNGKWQK